MTETPATISRTDADRRFDLLEATKAVARLAQTHELRYLSIRVDECDGIDIHVRAKDYPAWIDQTRYYKIVTFDRTASGENFRATATVDVDGHTVGLTVLLPVGSFIPADEELAVA